MKEIIKDIIEKFSKLSSFMKTYKLRNRYLTDESWQYYYFSISTIQV